MGREGEGREERRGIRKKKRKGERGRQNERTVKRIIPQINLYF